MCGHEQGQSAPSIHPRPSSGLSDPRWPSSSLLLYVFTSNLKTVVAVQEEQSFLHLGELCADEVVELDLQRRLLSWIKKKYDCCSARLNLELTPQIDNSVFRNTRLMISEVNSLLLILSARRCKYQARVLRIDRMASVQAMCNRRNFSV